MADSQVQRFPSSPLWSLSCLITHNCFKQKSLITFKRSFPEHFCPSLMTKSFYKKLNASQCPAYSLLAANLHRDMHINGSTEWQTDFSQQDSESRGQNSVQNLSDVLWDYLHLKLDTQHWTFARQVQYSWDFKGWLLCKLCLPINPFFVQMQVCGNVNHSSQ